MKNLILFIIVASTLVSCAPTTEIVKSWMEPGAAITPGAANKALVIALVKDETSRRVIEDELVKRLKSPATPSYRLISADALKEASDEAFTQLVGQNQITHILMMRLADIEKETTYTPGTTTAYYGSYGRYYGYGANMYSTPGYYTTDKNYFIETTIFDVKTNKLLWTGTTKTVNPTNIDKTVNDIADVVSDKMRKDGLLKD